MGGTPNRSFVQGPAGSSADEVRRLLAVGKCKQAVEMAKDVCRLAASGENQSLLVDAYIGRIAQFQAKGALQDAQVLLNLVHDRFPAYRQRLQGLRNASAAAAGNIAEMVAPLATADVTDETRQSVESAIHRQLVDLSALADCCTLPTEHPLRVAAQAVWKAFVAATSGAVSDQQIALPEVSRRSPLAGWKMLIRAIAALHRGEAEACQRALAAIPADAAVYRLVPVLRGVLEGKPAGSGAAAVLQMRLGGNTVSVRKCLERVDAAFEGTDLRALKAAMWDAARASETVSQEFHLRLLRQLAARCILHDVPMQAARSAWRRCPRNAEFWRAIAAANDHRAPELSPVFWQRFVVHAVDEGLFAEESIQVAVVYLHAAEQLIHIMSDSEELGGWQDRVAGVGLLSDYYDDQPPEIAAMRPRDECAVIRKALDPHWLFESAATACPDQPTFEKWWAWAQQSDVPDKQRQYIATVWHRMLPQSAKPLLLLSSLAENRDALTMALGFLCQAEAIDAINPEVRRARIRLLLATLWRHAKAKKPHLVRKDIAALEALPAMGEGDRASYLWVLRCVCCELERDVQGKAEAAQKVAERFGPMAGMVLLQSAENMAHLPGSTQWPLPDHTCPNDAREVARAYTRAFRTGQDMGLGSFVPATWLPLMFSLLTVKDCPLSNDDVLLFGNLALGKSHSLASAYAASAIGLSRTTGAMAARFLLLRAQSLGDRSFGRVGQCLRAAMELAQQAHDVELMEKVRIAANPGVQWRRITLTPLGEDLLQQVLKAEREASVYPTYDDDLEKSQVIADDPMPLFPTLPSLPSSGFDDDEGLPEYGEDEEEEDADDDPLGGFDEAEFDELSEQMRGLPREAIPLMMRLLIEHGTSDLDELAKHDPKTVARLRAIMAGYAGPAGTGGRNRRKKKARRR